MALIKSLESVFVPTSPSQEIDKQRAIAGANYLLDKKGDGQERYVLVSRIYNEGRFEGSQTEGIQRVLVARGVPEDLIEHESKSKNSRENVVYSGEFFKSNDTTSAVINSDFWHAKRLKMLFAKASKLGYAPKDLLVSINYEGISQAYPRIKGIIALAKDLILPL